MTGLRASQWGAWSTEPPPEKVRYTNRLFPGVDVSEVLISVRNAPPSQSGSLHAPYRFRVIKASPWTRKRVGRAAGLSPFNAAD
jgi:hypothetical protein